MADEDGRPAFCQVVKGLKDLGLGPGIQRTCGFVQHDDLHVA
jgi:hypothetical protein